MVTSGNPSAAPLAIMSGIAGTLLGIIVGYVVATGPRGAAGAGTLAPAAPLAPVSPQSSLVDERELDAFRQILASDPKNVRAAIELGNRLYDAGRYAEAVPYYQRALELDPRNINVSTDLGTALWYSGRPDEALAQYAKSLAIDPAHPQTLFNIGIVRLEGKQDAAGAIEAWEKLLATNPGYPEADKVRRLLDQARQQAGGAAAAPPARRPATAGPVKGR